MADTGSGVYRVCDRCGGVDDHPRHSIVGSTPGVAIYEPIEGLDKVVEANLTRLFEEGKISMVQGFAVMASFRDTGTLDLHLDCCAQNGCPAEYDVDKCDRRLAVWNGETGTGMFEAAEAMRPEVEAHNEELAAAQAEA